MEKTLNLFIGSILLANLYYLGDIIGLSSSTVIFFTVIISFFGFVLRFNLSNLNLLGTKLTIRLIVLSVILIIPNISANYEFNFNDLIRVISYTCYFCWTFSIHKKNSVRLEDHFRKLIQVIFSAVILMSIFEYFFYDSFKTIITKDFISYENNRRLSTTFQDPNAFAFAVVAFAYIYSKIEKSFLKTSFILLVTIVLINLSGSRLGFLCFIVLFLPLFASFFQTFKVYKITVIYSILVSLFFLPNLANRESNTASILERAFDISQASRVAASNSQRLLSIESGFKASNLSNIVFPPGNLLFRSKWENVGTGRHYPHSTFLYMFVEYGVFVIWPLSLFISFYKISKKTEHLPLCLISLISLLLLPNLIYYSTIFLIIFYIENENRRYITISKK